MHRSTLLAFVFCPALLYSQSGPAISSGQRVRVSVIGVGRSEATFEAITTDSLLLRSATGELSTVARSQVVAVEVFQGRSRQTAAGVVIGAFGGMALGYALGSGLGGGGSYACSDPGNCGLAVGLLAGAVVGGIIGSRIRSDQWKQARLPEQGTTMTVIPTRTGVRVGVRIALGH